MAVTPVISEEMHAGQGVALTVREPSVSFNDRYAFFSLIFVSAAAGANVAVRLLVG